MKNIANIVVLLVVSAGLALSQSDTAVVFGVVKDPSGSAIAGATVLLRNEATGGSRELQSNDNGLFYFTLVPSGSYEFTVEAAGFKQYRDSHVRIQVAQVGRIDVPMELGNTSEILEVEGNISTINSGNASEGTIITGEKLPSLPLNGRQFLQLALLVPGVNPGGRAVQQDVLRQGQNNIGGLSIAGNRTNNTNFLLDGAVNIDPDYSALNYSPSIDSVAEFQVQTAMVPAEYSRASVNVVSKSGTNEWHGAMWEFLRNKDLDSRPYNVPSLYQFERNQFGANAGGAAIKNRLFGFLAYEGLRVTQAGANQSGSTPVTVTLPTLAERVGNFSADKVIKDPSTGIAYPGNQIPLSQLNPISLAAVGILPSPVSGASYVNAVEPLRQNNGNYSARFDYAVTPVWNLFTRYSRSNENADVPFTIPNRDSLNDARSQNAVLGSTYTITPNVVNETHLGFSRLRLTLGLQDPQFNVNGVAENLPQMNLGGSYPLFGGAGGFNTTNPGGGIALSRDTTYQAYDNLAWNRGRQAFKFGAEVEQVNYARYETPAVLGSFQFTGKFSGNSVADYLLADSATASRSIGPDTIDARQYIYGFYMQDDIHVLKNLTVNLGLRYELAPPFYDLHKEMGSIDYSGVPSPQQIFATGPLAHYTPTFFVCGESGYPKGCAYTDKNNFAPRVGAAWSINPKTVVRAGGGFFYVNSDANPLFRLAAGLPNNLAQTLTIGSYSPSTQGFNIFGPGILGPAQIQAAGIDLNQKTSYSMQWNFSVQRELAKNVVLEVGYLATLGLKLEQNVQPNNSQPSTNTAVDPRRPYGSLIYAPGTQFPSYLQVQGSSVPVGFINFLPHSAQSNYESGFIRLEKRFSHGISFLNSYTYSKVITNAPQFRNAGGVSGSENSPPQNSYDLSAERGLAAFDLRNRWTSTAIYDLPFGSSGRWLRNGWAGKAAGGFEVSGILTMQSGFPFTINLKGDTANVGAGTGGIYVRPNVVGTSQYLPSSQQSTAEWFNVADFANPGAGNFGDLGRNTLIGPSLFDLDLVLQKNITIMERVKLQIRAEFFNTLNHSNYNIVDRIFADPSFGAVQSQLDPRQLQFGLKLIF
jgi:carboxypeptidase family protein/TonB-dependent receptor-like protein